MTVRVLDDAGAVAALAAARFGEVARDAIATRGIFRVALPGGRTPVAMMRALWMTHPLEPEVWAHTSVLFADERAVPPHHPDSNYRLVRESLLDPLGADAPAVHRMRGEAEDLDSAAREADALFAEPVDLLVLGLGEDGHVASLFPGSPLLGERARRVAVARDCPKPPPVRLTVTPRVLREAREAIVLATGAEKAPAAAAALVHDGDASRTPARLVRERTWLLDRAAAAFVA